MKFNVEKASDWSYKGVVEINTLDELMNWVQNITEHPTNKNWFPSVIIHLPDNRMYYENTLIIYDDYLE